MTDAPAPRPKTKATAQGEYPPGTIVTWQKGDGPLAVKHYHAPTVQVSGECQPPIEFFGSVDGAVFEKIRDVDGDPYRVTKPGVFSLPVAVTHLWPAINSDATVKTFLRN